MTFFFNKTLLFFKTKLKGISLFSVAQSAKVVVYTDCISAAGWDSPNACHVYKANQYYGEALVMLEL